jgi:hypothetical protein
VIVLITTPPSPTPIAIRTAASPFHPSFSIVRKLSETCQTLFSSFQAEVSIFAPENKNSFKTHMKRTVILLFFAVSSVIIFAQTDKEVNLGEVVVNGARVINKVDGQQIIPSAQQKEKSTTVYGLLGKLALPGIRIDEVLHTITALNNRGSVQIRINGIIATKSDLLSLDLKAVKNIDFIDNPGLRYGNDIGYVIDLHTRRATDGYTTGFDLGNTLTATNGGNSLFGSVNHGNSQWAFNYDQSYEDLKGFRNSEDARYLLSDGTVSTISRSDISDRTRSFGNNFQLKYNVADSASYVFQGLLSTELDNSPRTFTHRKIIDGTDEYEALASAKSKNMNPVIDLYFFHQLGQRQSITANLVGTHIHTTGDSYYDEGSPYHYRTRGNTYSLIGEAIYENRLKPFTFSAGMNTNLKYTHNTYADDVNSTNSMHAGGVYLFSQIKGTLSKFRYMAGLGVSDQRYSQGSHHYNYWLWRPKATLSYPIFDGFIAKCDFELTQHISQIAMIGDTRIRQNSREWTVGNPDLTPSSRISSRLSLAYDKPRFGCHFDSEYRVNRNCNMAKYTRTADDQFLYTQTNQHGVDMLYLQNSTHYDVIPDHLTVTLGGGIFRFFTRGDDYRHCFTFYSCSGSLQGYLGPWSLSAYVDNGWRFIEDVTFSNQHSAVYFSLAYHIGNCDITAYWQNPFLKSKTLDSAETVSSLLHKNWTSSSSDLANMVSIHLAWKLSKGKKYRDIEQTLKNRDKETGILK